MTEDLSTFEKSTGLNFNNKNLLKNAFIHKSYLNEHPDEHLDNNERLEYLGDAVMELVITNFLYHKYPDKPEGELTALRAALVNTNSISKVGGAIGLNKHLLLSKGESKSEGRARQYILANTFEAVIGATYLDGGIEIATKFIEKFLVPELDEIVEKRLWLDDKSFFQEKAQEYKGITPTYEVLGEDGPDHNKKFTVGVFLDSKRIETGEGRSKQEAEQDAAGKALKREDWT